MRQFRRHYTRAWRWRWRHRGKRRLQLLQPAGRGHAVRGEDGNVQSLAGAQHFIKVGDFAERSRAAGVFGLQRRMREPVLDHGLRPRPGLGIIGQPYRSARGGAGVERGQAAVERGIVHAQRQQHDRPHPASVVVAGGSVALAGLRPAPAQCNGNGNVKSWHSVGWRGGSG